MLTNFKIFGFEHIISLVIPIIIGVLFIILAKKYPERKKLISIMLAILIIAIRSVRYGFDIYLGNFSIFEIFSIHVCHLDLILLVICLIKPNQKLFIFTFLIGIPTALAVALMPGQSHAAPGMLRAIFFIMSHMMLVMGSIYILIIYDFKIIKKDLSFYYIFALVGIIIVYIFNLISSSNFMYLMSGPKDTVLEKLYQFLGPFWYIFSIYIILVLLLTLLFIIYNLIIKLNGSKKLLSTIN